MLDECFNKQMLLEGKHWPEDYVKTGINLVKASSLGQQSWYSNSYIQQDIKTFADEFGPLSHKNSNLGFFSTIVKWFTEYSGTSKPLVVSYEKGVFYNTQIYVEKVDRFTGKPITEGEAALEGAHFRVNFYKASTGSTQDYSKLKPILFEPRFQYLRTGEVVGPCVQPGKAFAAKQQ